MNLITKLLMENKVSINPAKTIIKKNVIPSIAIFIEGVEGVEKRPTKKDLLAEVPEQYYVSTLEWMLLKYWQENDVQTISIDDDTDIRIDAVNTIEAEYFYQYWSKQKLFQFLEVGKEYKLNDLINHCALIEG